MNTIKRLFIATIIVTFIFGCLEKPPLWDQNLSDSERVEYLLSKMTLEEKISFTHANSKFNVGGIEHLAIPAWKMSDGPHGVREEIEQHSWKPTGWTTDSASYFPVGTALSATWNPGLAYQFGIALGEEARARNKDVILGPGINIMRTPLCGRNFEYMGEDPYLAAKMAVPYIKGVQEQDVAASLKHFALNNQEYERSSINVEIDERSLREIYLPGYKAAVQEANVMTVMAGYNKVRGEWCAENKMLINDILKEEWGFKGVVMSDWNGTHSTVPSALAGLDVEMGTAVDDYGDYYFAKPLLEAVKAGQIDEKIINDKARRVLTVMVETKMFEEGRSKGVFTTPTHFNLAKQVAEEAVVLLKNENQILPLNQDNIKSIAIIGDNATRKHAAGGGSSGIKAIYEVSPLAGLQKKLANKIELNFVQGYKRTTEFSWSEGLIDTFDLAEAKQLRQEAVKAAAKTDLAIVFGGLNHDFDTEGIDRKDMKMPYQQDILISEVVAANPNTIIVLISGSPVEMLWIDEVPAVIQGWYAGMEAGNVFADILFGDINPSGKITFSFPEKLMDSPAHKLGNYPGEDLTTKYEEGIFVGYRWFDKKNIAPLFSFGHGLSYTVFEYSDLTIRKGAANKDSLLVSLKVKNSGSMAGKEIVQLYIQDIEASVDRPEKELKEFEKVNLQPGESREISFKLPESAFAFYDAENNQWKVEPGKFKIYVGSSSRDIRLSKVIDLFN